MIVNDLSKELGVKNKDLIDFLKSNDFKISSHMQTVNDDMIEKAKEHFKTIEKQEKVVTQASTQQPKKVKPSVPKRTVKKFAPDDQIPCKSLVPWRLVTVGADKMTTYSWPGFGHVEYVSYKDLQAMRRHDIIKDALVMIEDPDICEQWKHDLGSIYDRYLGVEYPEEFFDVSDEQFRDILQKAPDVFKNVIKYTAMDMIRNENYPTLQKILIIDEILGTGIKEFL